MSGRFYQFAGAAVLLIWGGMMIYFYASGRISVYLAQEFRIYSLVAGLGLCVLGLFNLLTRGTEPDCCGHDHDHGAAGHSHAHGERIGLIPLVILLVPLVGAARISPDRFSQQAVINKGLYSANYEAAVVPEASRLELAAGGQPGVPAVEPGAEPKAAPDGDLPAPQAAAPSAPVATGGGTQAAAADAEPAADYGQYTLADLEAQVDKSPEGRFLLTVPQLFYTAGDEELQRVLKGLPVETVGQVMPEKVNNPNGTRLRIFRLFIECCAADARPLSIPIEFGKAAPSHREMGWVKVTGKMIYSLEDGMTVPVLEVESMEETAPPEDEMIF